MKTNVLIFGGGGYNAQEVYWALKDTVRYHPILASSNDNHSTFISKDAITDLPYDNDPNYINALNNVIDERNINFVIPTHDTNAVILMEHESEIHAIVVCSPYETAKICRYKSLTYKALENTDFVPKTYEKDGKIDFPAFAKDDTGQGSRNSVLLREPSDLNKLDPDIDYIICEYLPGEEITIDCFTDRKGHLRFAQPRIRARILSGQTGRGVLTELTPEIKHIVETINQKIKFRGYWYVQCRKDADDKFKLMEISTRCAGTFNLSKSLDVNLPLLALADFSNMDIQIIPNKAKVLLDKSYIDRYKLLYDYQRVYIDFDDTLVFERKRYNPEAMRFIYQCLNDGKEIVLITKHAYDIVQDMKTLKLNSEIFNSIIEVPEDQPKYKYMNNDVPSIFIDNSFSERIGVKEHLDMPTFDVCNIECLIDWSE